MVEMSGEDLDISLKLGTGGSKAWRRVDGYHSWPRVLSKAFRD